jgi:hypothetical protein
MTKWAALCVVVLWPGLAVAQGSVRVETEAAAVVIDAAGVTFTSAISLAPTARPSTAGVRAGATPGTFTVNGPAGQTFSVEGSQTVALSRSSGQGQLVAKVSQGPVGAGGIAPDIKTRTIRMEGALALPASAPAGLYVGQVRFVVEFN